MMASNLLRRPRQWIPLQQQLVPQVKEAHTAYQRNVSRRHRETIQAALKQGYLKYLDQELILRSQVVSEKHEPASDLSEVLRISLSGCHVQALDDIAILSCAKLRICDLGSCYLRDISAFYGCVNLLKLELSDNQISQLPPSDFWSSLSSLRVLYLHGNSISNREALSRLNGCSVLHILTLYNTPLALLKNYRHHVVNSILSLRALDHHVISDEEIIENLRLSGSFQPMSDHFKLQLYISFLKDTRHSEELSKVYRLLLSVDKVLAKHSPVVMVQRWVRGWLVRKALAKSSNSKIRSLVNKKQRSLPFKPHPQDSTLTGQGVSKTVISAEIPSSKRHLKHATTHKKDKHQNSLPPPPPTSPYHCRSHTPLPVETHVVGMDAKSSRTKYFMHINLRKLQQTVLDAEHSEPEGVNMKFRSAFKKAPGKLDVSKPQQGARNKAESSYIEATTDSSTVSKLTSTVAHSAISPQHQVMKQSGDLSEDDTHAITVSGQMAQILPHEQLPHLATVKKNDGKDIREAEREISRTLAEVREPVKVQSKSNASSKDELLFTRACNTMALSTLRSVEHVHQSRKRADALNKKMSIVTKVKQDRVVRKAKIENFHKNVREKVRDWRNQEACKLNEQRTKLQEKRNSDIHQCSQSYDKALENRQAKLQDQTFACEFGHQNTMVGSTLLREDYKARKDIDAVERKDIVREAREVAQEHHEMVKRYMELRRLKLLQEGKEARKKLDSTMLEAASNRLIESKRKIARETARKQAAREAITLTKEELRKGPHGPGESLPANQGPPVITDSNEQGQVHPSTFSLNRTNTKFTSPSHVRHMSRDLHNTWQRGSRAIKQREEGHFPLLTSNSDTPLMYGMMQPGAKRKSLVELPVLESETSSSPTSSVLVTKQLSVR